MVDCKKHGSFGECLVVQKMPGSLENLWYFCKNLVSGGLYEASAGPGPRPLALASILKLFETIQVSARILIISYYPLLPL